MKTIHAISNHLNNNGIPNYPIEFLDNPPFIRIPQISKYHNIDIHQEKQTIKLSTNFARRE